MADMGVPPPTDTSAPLAPPNPASEDRAEDPILPKTNIGHQGETDVRVADDSETNIGEAQFTVGTGPLPGQGQDPVITEVATSAPDRKSVV